MNHLCQPTILQLSLAILAADFSGYCVSKWKHF